METSKEAELIDTIGIDIGTEANKAHSILQSIIDNYFNISAEAFQKDKYKKYELERNFEQITNLLFATDDYILEIKQIADNI